MEKIAQIYFVNSNSFYYSLTKFIIIYHSPKLIQALYCAIKSNNGELFKKELLNHLGKAITELKNIERKQREVPALEDIYTIIDMYEFDNSIKSKYDFIYFQNFEGLINLLNELKISTSKVNLIIDKEEKTYLTAKNYDFNQVRQADSIHSIEVRIADHLCGFIGRMMYALINDESIKEDPVTDIDSLGDNDLVRKHLLSSSWFDIQEKHLILYKKIYNVLVKQQPSYWSTLTLSYSDQVCMFYTLLRYFSQFKNYEDYKKYSLKEHLEYYNSCCCNELERHYKTLEQ